MSGAESIYQILYCSRNLITGSKAELKQQIQSVLQSSRRNNAEAGVTGALFYNDVFFAQVLEGPFEAVQATFERIQMDPRHSDLVVLQCGYIATRDFPSWSMAFAASSSDFQLPVPASALAPSVSASSENGEKVLLFLREIVVQQEDWALPVRAAACQR